MKNRIMTKKEMISACVDDQIARGIMKKEQRALQIKARLKGGAGLPPMGWHDLRHVCVKRIGKKLYECPQCIGIFATDYEKGSGN